MDGWWSSNYAFFLIALGMILLGALGYLEKIFKFNLSVKILVILLIIFFLFSALSLYRQYLLVNRVTQVHTELSNLAPRELSETQVNHLVQRLSGCPDERRKLSLLVLMGDVEGRHFAEQLLSAFRQAGWEVNGIDTGVVLDDARGLILHVHDNNSPESCADLIQHALEEIGYPVKSEQPENGQMFYSDRAELIIGAKPMPTPSAKDLYNLGVSYEKGQGVPRDYGKAVELYQKAVDQGYAEAQNNLGGLYMNGQGVPQDYGKAVELYQKAATQRFAGAQYNLGVLYNKGRGVPQDHGKAVELYQKAAAQGYPAAQNNLGVLYENGQGVPQDYGKAVELYQKAAAQGYPAAQYNLGGLYLKGQGVPHDYGKAVELYEKAAAQGCATAQNNLGVLYENGQGVPQDYIQAYMWYSLAAIQGFQPAVQNANALNGIMTPSQIAEAQRLVTERKSREQN